MWAYAKAFLEAFSILAVCAFCVHMIASQQLKTVFSCITQHVPSAFSIQTDTQSMTFVSDRGREVFATIGIAVISETASALHLLVDLDEYEINITIFHNDSPNYIHFNCQLREMLTYVLIFWNCFKIMAFLVNTYLMNGISM